MNCELAHERIVTAAYGELPDAEAHQLERHIERCPACRREREELLALKLLANAYPPIEPDANLIARSRIRLAEALDELPPLSGVERLRRRLFASFIGLRAVPLAAAAMLVLGLAAGTLGGYRLALSRAAAAPMAGNFPPPPPPGMMPGQRQVANISSVVRRPDSNLVEVSYNQVVPQRVQGQLDDPNIRQLLMMASEDQSSPGVRDNSVELLAAECRAGHSCKPSGIRDALIVALRYDKSESVREKALKGLEPYVAEDVRVRDAILVALLYDASAKVRAEAISILEPVEADTSVRQVLRTVASSDQNSHIRTVSRQVLSRMPEIQ